MTSPSPKGDEYVDMPAGSRSKPLNDTREWTPSAHRIRPSSHVGQELLFEWFWTHLDKLLGSFFALLIAVVTYTWGPKVVEDIRASVERSRLESQLISKVIDTTAALDPSDLRSITRFGVVADLLGTEPSAKSLDFATAKLRLRELERDLRRGSLGVLQGEMARKKAEIERLLRQKERLSGQLTALRGDAVRPKTTGAATAPEQLAAIREREVVAGGLSELIEEHRQLIAELQKSRERDENSWDHFATQLQSSATMREDEHRAIEALERLVTGIADQAAQKTQLGQILTSLKQRDADIAKTLADLASGQRRAEESVAKLELEKVAIATDNALLAQQLEKMRRVVAQAHAQREQLEHAVARIPNATVAAGPLGLVISIADRPAAASVGLFASGKAELTAATKAALGEVAAELFKLGDNMFQVRGHTDETVPARNLELSSARALAVVNFLTERSKLVPSPLRRENFVVSGCAYSQPVQRETTPEARAKNRRVEIIVLPH